MPPKAAAKPVKRPAAKRPAAAPRAEKTKPQGAASSKTPASTTEVTADDVVDGREVWLATDALHKTKAMRNYFQLERDRIQSFWELSKTQLADVQGRIRDVSRARAELEDRQAIEEKVFKQKIRHLLYENQLQLSSMREEAERTLAEKEDQYRLEENNARKDIRDMKLMDREMEVQHREQQAALMLQQDKEIAEQQTQFEREVREVHLAYEQMLKTLRDETDKARTEEITQIERRKDEHIAALSEVHARTFKEMKDYYSEITTNNLETIRTLKDELFARKRTENHNERAMLEVAQRNKKLTEPLAKLQRQKEELTTELANYLTDKEALLAVKAEVKTTNQEYQTLSWEHEVLTQRYAKLVEDRDIILSKFNALLQDIQRKSAFRRVLLQKKLELVQSQLEGRDAKFTELLERANVHPEDIKELKDKVHDMLSEKDKTIEDLQNLLLRATERSEEVVSIYESYLSSNGVSGLSATTTAPSL